MIANNKTGETERNKIATFLWLVGEHGVEIYNTLFPNNGDVESMFGGGAAGGNVVNQPVGGAAAAAVGGVNNQPAAGVVPVAGGGAVQQRTLAQVIDAFDAYCLPRKNLAVEAFKFNLIVQKEKQPFAEFETALRTQLAYCEFECEACQTSYADRMLRDRIILGIQDKKLQLKLLDGKNEPLVNIIEMCKVYEAAAENKQLLERKEVHNVTDKSTNGESEVAALKTLTCYNCGQPFNGRHRRYCPAIDVVCDGCGRRGHFKRYCRTTKHDSKSGVQSGGSKGSGTMRSSGGSKYDTKQTTSNTNVHMVNWADAGNFCEVGLNDIRKRRFSSRSNSNYRINSNATSSGEAREKWTKRYLIQDWPVNFKLDTGADVNCIPLSVVTRMKIPLLNKRSFNVVDYSSNEINIHGHVTLQCVDEDKGLAHTADFLVVDDSFEPLLGLESCVSFGLIERLNSLESSITFPSERERFIESNADVFEGLGKLPGTCRIILKENAIPSLHYKKRIPMSLHDRLKKELEAMEEHGIISPVDYPTDWVNNMQIVEKPNGSLRICLDPKPLNACIRREHFLIPKSEDLLSRMSGKRVFTVLDLRNGFWQMELDRQSSDLTTFMTPFGRYRWNRLPFGISSAPELFQKRMVQLFGDIPGVEVYFDDVAVAGETFEEHDKTLAIVLERARKNNVKFNSVKTQYRSDEVKFMGHIMSDGQIRPDQSYVSAILDMPKPKTKSDVLRLLGLLKYLGKFIPNLSKRTAALRELSRNDVEWAWTDVHERELEDLRSSLTATPVLAIFDPNKPVTVQTDSSKDGLGSVLMQDGQAIAYASRTLSNSEKKWAQIEKELLAIVFACERFHYFLYGHEFVVQSDHKPLESLVKRDIDDVTPRLQRMFLHLLKYPGMCIKYTPGKEMLVADCLSRAALPSDKDLCEELSGMIHTLSRSVCLSPDNYKLYVETLDKDERYRRIIGYVEHGWPGYHQLDDLGQLFYKHRHLLHYENGLLFKEHRLVVPTLLQSTISKWLHAPHLGMEKTLARARAQFFWPGMSNDISELVKECTVCEKFTRNIQKEPLHQDSPPCYPFQRVGIDLYEYAGHDHVVIIDAYSGYVISRQLSEKSARHVIDVLDRVFCDYGYPTQIRCDNVPFNSSAFDSYANECNIEFVFSSPRYPQSNGLAEKGVAIAKNILKRSYEAGDVKSFRYRLLEYNSTPVASMGVSPCQLFFGRQLKTRLPTSSGLLLRNNLEENRVTEMMERKRRYQKHYYDRSSKPLPVLNIGDSVIFKKNGKEWHYGQIVRIVNSRSYVVRDGFGNHFRRNRRFIAKTRNGGPNANELDYEDHIAKYLNRPDRPARVIVPSYLCVSRSTPDQPPPVNLDFQEGERSEPQSPDTSLSLEADPESFYTASDSESPIDVDLSNAMSESDSDDTSRSVPYKTRSGRVVRPPNRLDI